MSQASSSSALLALMASVVLALAGCGSSGPEGVYKLGRPYQVAGRWYYPEFDPAYDKVGIASWYGVPFHGRATANGEVFDRDGLTAAHPTLPLPSIVRVTNLANHRQLELRVNDRGPFVGDRLIDLSQAAARALGFERQGTARVRVEFVSLAEAKGAPSRPRQAPARREPAAPTPQTTLVAASPAALCAGQFIQIGAFAEPERAWNVAARMQGSGVAPVSTERPSSDRLIRVRLGPIPDPHTVEATLHRLKRAGYPGAFVIGRAPERAPPC
jgi:rare lipoprotein A